MRIGIRLAPLGPTLRIAAFALASLIACEARADIVIGVALPRTGPVASVGEQVFKGANAAAKDINDKGGILGQKLVLAFEELVRQSGEQGYAAQWFGTSGISIKEFSAIAGPASDGVLMTFNPDPRRRDEAKSVVSAFKAQGIDPDGFTLYAYTAVEVIAQAAEMAGSADPKAVGAAIKAKRFPTILGEVGFDAKGGITARRAKSSMSDATAISSRATEAFQHAAWKLRP